MKIFHKMAVFVLIFTSSDVFLIAAYNEKDFVALARSTKKIRAELAKGIHPDEITCQRYGYFNQTLLGQVAAYGDVQGVEVLLDAGAAINKRSSLRQTPLFQAAYDAQSGTVQYLLERGADHSERGLDYSKREAIDIEALLQTPLELVRSEMTKCSSDLMKAKYQAVENILSPYEYCLK